jgi:hypothetical protein
MSFQDGKNGLFLGMDGKKRSMGYSNWFKSVAVGSHGDKTMLQNRTKDHYIASPIDQRWGMQKKIWATARQDGVKMVC